MAGQRLTDKTALTEQLASGDLLMTVDVSDSTGSASGTSKQIANKYVIQTDTVTGNLDLNTNPLTLVSAPGAGYFIQPLTITVIFTYVSVSIAGGYAYFSYDSSSTTNYLARHRDLYKSETADRTYIFGGGIGSTADGTYAGSIENKGLYMYGMDLTGSSTFKVFTTYQTVKIA